MAAAAEQRQQIDALFNAALVPALGKVSRDIPEAITTLTVLCAVDPESRSSRRLLKRLRRLRDAIEDYCGPPE